MTKFADKLLRGEPTSPTDWTEHLKVMHRDSPSQTPHVFEDPRGSDGLNSYGVLLTAVHGRRQSLRILDLACGDGHLIPYIEKKLGTENVLVGVDMSPDELGVARAKNFESTVTFKCEMADHLTEDAASFDIVFCHMAFMLMNPLEPIVQEIGRVLKPQGLFAAVVSGGAPRKDFMASYQKKVAEFIQEKFPKYGRFQVGDPRVRTLDGIREIFDGPLFGKLEIKEFAVTAELPTGKVWSFFKDMYNVSVLPAEHRQELQKIVTAEAVAVGTGSELITFEFPMRLITAERT